MLLKTIRFGEIEVNPEKVITFPKPLLGLPNSFSYVILDVDGNTNLKWLQSCNQPEVALVISDPKFFFPDYRIQVTREELEVLNVEDGDECGVEVILVVPADPRKITANLLAPLVINVTKKRGTQVILNETPYSTRQYIFPPAEEAV